MMPKGAVNLGKHCSGTPYVYMFFRDNVTIGNFCSIGPDVIIVTSMGHIPNNSYMNKRVSTFPLAGLKKNGFKKEYTLPSKGGYVKIGNDVWIGARSIILPTVTIGDGVIVGAGAVVTHNVPPYAIIGGVPARVIRYRYSDEQIRKLLEIAWWNWDEDKIKENLDYFYGDVDEFIREFGSN